MARPKHEDTTEEKVVTVPGPEPKNTEKVGTVPGPEPKNTEKVNKDGAPLGRPLTPEEYIAFKVKK